jgi:tetratricopeptide (TPR) repeat protein
LKIAKYTAALLIFVALLYVGQRGRQQASLKTRVDLIGAASERLQSALNDEPTVIRELIAGFGASTNVQPSVRPQVDAPLAELKAHLQQFERSFNTSKLSEVQGFKIRMAKATVANAEKRFAEASSVISDEDEKWDRTGVLEVRADALFGAQQWLNAMERYQRLVALDTNQLPARARIAQCQFYLGQRDDAIKTIEEFVRISSARGDAFAFERKGNLVLAVRSFENAIGLQYLLIQQAGKGEWTAELVRNHNNAGTILLGDENGKPEAAVSHFENAMRLQSQVLEQGNRPELAATLALEHLQLGHAYFFTAKIDKGLEQYQRAAMIQDRLADASATRAEEVARSHHSVANVLLLRQKFDEAGGHYDRAIEILNGLLGQGTRDELRRELALSFNNRGVLRRAQGKPDIALEDFAAAIQQLDKATPEKGISKGSAGAGFAQVELDAVTGFSEKNMELITRTRIKGWPAPYEAAVARAMIDKNRAFALLFRGANDQARAEFEKAIEVFTRLVEREGQGDLMPQFSKSLAQLAWIYATNPNDSLRNGAKAVEYALKACELTRWKVVTPIETLAAACAERGDFAQAVKWQETAMRTAPAAQQNNLAGRLALYKSGQPHRSAPASL